MATSPQALIRGLVSRLLPSANPDGFNNDVAARMSTYGELMVMPLTTSSHAVADEGSYFILHNNQSAIAPPTATGFVATTPSFVVTNLDPTKRMYIDYIAITTITAFTAASGVGPEYATVVLDNTATGRYSSGGTQLTTTPTSPNMAVTTNAQLNAYFGAITATAASAAARTIVGQRMVRPAVSGTVSTVIGDTIIYKFGGIEVGDASITIANPNIIPIIMPPVILGPGQTLLLYTYRANTTPTAGTELPEMGFWLR